MTRPDPAACAVAGLFAAAAATFALDGWPLPAGILAGCAIAAAALYWRGRDNGAIDALIEATRETIPDHVPDAWTEEFK